MLYDVSLSVVDMTAASVLRTAETTKELVTTVTRLRCDRRATPKRPCDFRATPIRRTVSRGGRIADASQL